NARDVRRTVGTPGRDSRRRGCPAAGPDRCVDSEAWLRLVWSRRLPYHRPVSDRSTTDAKNPARTAMTALAQPGRTTRLRFGERDTPSTISGRPLRRGELGDDRPAVDPDLFAADEAVAEPEDVQDAERDPAPVAGNAEHLADDRASHVLLENHRVTVE